MMGQDLRCKNLRCEKLLARDFKGEQVSIMCFRCRQVNTFHFTRVLTGSKS